VVVSSAAAKPSGPDNHCLTVPVHGLHVYNCFAENTRVDKPLTVDSGLFNFLTQQDHFELRLEYEQGRPCVPSPQKPAKPPRPSSKMKQYESSNQKRPPAVMTSIPSSEGPPESVLIEFGPLRFPVGSAKLKLKQFSYSFVDKHTTFVPMSLPGCSSPHACMAKVSWILSPSRVLQACFTRRLEPGDDRCGAHFG
jgi:hypothetical protein